MNDRRLVRGGCGPFAIEIVLQDGGDRAIGVRTDLECPCTGCFEPLASVCLEVPQDADAGAKALLGRRPLAQDYGGERRRTWTDLAGLPLDALQRPVGEAPMARGHVIGQRAVLATIQRDPRVHGQTIAAWWNTSTVLSVKACPHLFAQHGMRHRVEVGLDLDAVIDPDTALLPLREDIGSAGRDLSAWRSIPRTKSAGSRRGAASRGR